MKHGFAFVVLGLVFTAACSSSPDTGDGGQEGGSTDAKPDKVTSNDSGGDAASTCKSGLTCEVCDGTFSTSQMTAPYQKAGACTAGDITAFVTACGAAGTEQTCDAWQNAEVDAGPSCLDCTFSSSTASKWGVYVCDDNAGTCSFNTPGCLDVALATVAQEKQAGGSGSCGDLYNDAYDCESYACNSCVSQTDFDSCLSSADDNECKQYADLAYSTTGTCAAANDPDASATINSCFNQNDTDLATMTALLCGAP
ncbi:MAG TPA: hypothetical protein VH054_27875 [Polyangiaceae bacterium]|jgi:hypothetical protein|nr:hypothetical protein [Polyangiaceae bacterium]